MKHIARNMEHEMMKQKTITIIFIAITILLGMKVSSASAATYFMRADGTATSKAQATGPATDKTKCMNVAKHNSQTFSPGDNLLLSDKGGEYKAYIAPPSSGAEEGQITYANVPGESPVLDPSFSVESWDGQDANGAYFKAAQPTGLLWDNGKAVKKGSSSSVNAGEWYQDDTPTGTLYYKPLSGSPGAVRRTRGDNLLGVSVVVRNKNYLKFQNLIFKKSTGAVFIQNWYPEHTDLRNITVTSCTFQDSAFAVDFTGSVGSEYQTTGCEVTNSSFSYCGSSIRFANESAVNIPGKAFNDNNHKVSNNRMDHNGWASTDLDVNWSKAIGYPIDVEPISFQDLQDSEISGNIITGALGPGIVLASLNGTMPTSGNVFVRNYIESQEGTLYLAPQFASNPGFSGNIFDSNIFINSATDSAYGAVILGGHPYNSPEPNQLSNNVIYSSAWQGIRISTNEAGNWVIKNNIIAGSGMCHIFKDKAGSSPGHTYDINNNLYYPDSSRKFYAGGYLDFHGWQAAGFDSQSPNPADPLFANLSGNFFQPSDFRLQSTSPAIDAGANVGLTEDYEGTPVPQGAAPDIGAFEYSSGAPTYPKSDINQDSLINITDLGILMSDFGKTAANALNPRSDINTDGSVNVIDLGILMSEWG